MLLAIERSSGILPNAPNAGSVNLSSFNLAALMGVSSATATAGPDAIL
jgi:hypothetical protein